jgi:hypothetical protein
VQAWNDPKRYLKRSVHRYAGSWVPNVIAKGAQFVDPVYREKKTVQDTILSRIPWMSEKLPAARKRTGAEIVSEMTPAERGLSPFWRQKVRPARLETLMLDVDYNPSSPARSVTIPKTGRLKLELTREEREMFFDADKSVTEKLRRDVERGRFDNWPPYKVKDYFAKQYNDAAAKVRKKLWRQRTFLERVKARKKEAGF